MSNAQPIAMTEILPSDVLMGRGKLVHHHMGNVVFRNEVKDRSGEFQVQCSLARDTIARDILENVHRRGGRFLRPIARGDASQWEICPIRLALTKVKQALRDAIRLESSTATRTSSSSSDVHTLGGASAGTQPEPSAASGAARLLSPGESPSTLGGVGIARSTEVDEGRSNKHSSHRAEEPTHSSFVGHQGHHGPQNEPFSGEYQLHPTIASLQHSTQHRRRELAGHDVPRSLQGPVAHTSVIPQAVPLATSVLPHMASLRNQNDSSRSSIHANNRGSFHSTSSTPPADPSQQPSPLLPGRLSQPLDSEMSELLRRLRDGA